MQNSESITQFLKRRKSQRDSEQSAVDWNSLKEEWLADIESLFVMIRRWLVEAENEGLVTFHEKKIVIVEEHFGQYEAPALSIDLGDQVVVELTPAFRFTLGAQGRIDMVCGIKKAMIMRKDKHDWGIGTRESGSFKINSLDEELFSELLKDLTA